MKEDKVPGQGDNVDEEPGGVCASVFATTKRIMSKTLRFLKIIFI